MTYELIVDDISGKKVIKFIDENAKEFWIPTDLSNSDYQTYLATLPTELVDPSPADKPKK
jgi:hypothetical protein